VFNISVFNPSSEIILCESLVDALTFWVHGFTDEHLKALTDYSIEKLFIAYDNDEGGNKAATALTEKLQTELPQLQVYRVVFPDGTSTWRRMA